MLTQKESLKYISKFDRVRWCLYCKSKNTIDHPKTLVIHDTRDGLNVYKCTKCQKTFTILTGSLISRSKYPWEFWVVIMQHILKNDSIEAILKSCIKRFSIKNLNRKTVWNIRIKILNELAQLPKPQLFGVVQVGTIEFPLSNKGAGAQKKNDDNLRVLCAIDEQNYASAFVVDEARSISENLVNNLFEQLDFAQIICSELNFEYHKFANTYNLIHYVTPLNYRELLIISITN